MYNHIGPGLPRPWASYQKRKIAGWACAGNTRNVFPPPRVSDLDMYHDTCVPHVPWCIPGSLTSSFLWSRWQEKRSRNSRRMRNPQFYVSGKRLIVLANVFVWYFGVTGNSFGLWSYMSHIVSYHINTSFNTNMSDIWSDMI